MLPSKKQLARIRVVAQKKAVNGGENFSRSLRNKNSVHYGVFLLCYGAGLRVSEAIDFDLSRGTANSFIVKSKGHPRVALVPDGVVRELKSLNWQKNQTNRNNFFKYCQRLKKEAKLPQEVELTPHAGRKSFATYTAESGVPLPELAKMLGHKSFKTTAEYYWKDTYEGDKDIYQEKGENQPVNPFLNNTAVNKNYGFAGVKNEVGATGVEKNQAKFPTFDILKKPTKSKEYWQEYNKKRKDYVKQYYLKNKERFNRKFKERKKYLSTQLTTKQEQTNKIKNWNSSNSQILLNQHYRRGLG